MVDWTQSGVVLDVFSVIAALTTFCLTMSVYYNHYKYPNNFHNRRHKMVSTAGFTCYMLAMILMMVSHLSSDHKSFTYLLGFLIYVFFWGCGLCIVYILFILRLYTTFQSSAYHSSNYVYLSLYGSIFIWFICNLILIIIMLLEHSGTITAETEGDIHAGELIVKCITILYASIVLPYLFVSKLMKLTLTMYDHKECIEPMKKSEYSHKSTTESIQSNTLQPTPLSKETKLSMSMSTVVQSPIIVNLKLSQTDRNLLEVATKMTVLSSVMAISSLTLLILALISTFYGDEFLDGFLWYFGVMFGLMVDSSMNVLCMYLSLPYSSSRILYGFCCKNTFHKCCLFYAKKRLEQQKLNKAEKEDVQSTEMQQVI